MFWKVLKLYNAAVETFLLTTSKQVEARGASEATWRSAEMEMRQSSLEM
jgi:hypothetical protein